MKQLFYDLFILVYEFGAWLLSPFNQKARLWLKGRISWASRLKQQIKKKGFQSDGTRQTVWMHASSLGEFEQGRPVLESIREAYPNVQVILTFFSPSGYEVRKDYKGADLICYLPTDTPANAKKFIGIIKPDLVLWVKYEYWFHHLRVLHQRKIPVLLISGYFNPGQAFFKWYGRFYKQLLYNFDHYFLNNQEDVDLVKQLLLDAEHPDIEKDITISGDTRFDRVIEIDERWQPVAPLEKWLQPGDNVLVAGSTWPQDEEELVHFVRNHPSIKFIVAPHQVEASMLKDTLEVFPNALLFSDLLSEEPAGLDKNILVINNVGILSKIYRYATVCYIGGGFTGTGIHNVLEAAVYGKPVVHGPEYERYTEAIELKAVGGSFPVDNALELEEILRKLFEDQVFAETAAAAARDYVYSHSGGTRTIMNYIQAKRLLTSF